ncbi:hypothetical protein BKH41_04355 [Helicobacter sp. 12S02232-10]|uniref:acyl carrier protein n=1 Tax=Helicobacter sp. 12S02232-10 TaxID=1476197 RepID=UPI000BA704B8|nr:acyl carrier protein [Helicobacter sp. 12S02232-10]PAF48867.1 hypothetical protein BKH41_04355 [Helicobacter sp. 12S02232-10]
MQTLLNKIQDLLDVKDLDLQSKLNDFDEWDSLSMVALISFAQKYYHINISINELMACQNIQNICDLILPLGGGADKLKSSLSSISLLFSIQKSA